MKRNQIRKVVVHNAENMDSAMMEDRISEFHVLAIERRLNRLPLTREQKNTVIDMIVNNLKSGECGGAIE